MTYVVSLGGQKYPGWSGQNNGSCCTQKLPFAYIYDNIKFSCTKNISRRRNSLDKTRLYLFSGEKRDANLKQYEKETFITFI